MDRVFQIGDVIGFHDPWLLARWIRFFERLDDKYDRINHVAIVVEGSEDLARVVIMEALRRVRTCKLADYKHRKMVVYRWRNPPLGAGTRLHACVVRATGSCYGYGKIVLNALDCLFGTFWFTRLFGISHWKQCANLVGWCYRHILERDGVAFGVPWRCLRPDVIDQRCRDRQDLWECVRDDIGVTKRSAA